jgi:hypothetical protein
MDFEYRANTEAIYGDNDSYNEGYCLRMISMVSTCLRRSCRTLATSANSTR